MLLAKCRMGDNRRNIIRQPHNGFVLVRSNYLWLEGDLSDSGLQECEGHSSIQIVVQS